jgi:hypothetical protein
VLEYRPYTADKNRRHNSLANGGRRSYIMRASPSKNRQTRDTHVQ